MSGFQAIRVELSPLQVHSKGKRVHVTGDKVSLRVKRFTSCNGFDDLHGDEPPVHRNRWHMFMFKLHSQSLSPFHWRDSFKSVTSRRAGFNVDSESSGCVVHLNMRGAGSSDVAVHFSDSAQVERVLVITASSAKTKLADELHVALKIEVFHPDVSTKTCMVRKCMQPSKDLLRISVISALSFVKRSGKDLEIDSWCSSRSMAAHFTPGVSASTWSTRVVFSRRRRVTSSNTLRGTEETAPLPSPSRKTTNCSFCNCARTRMTKTSGSRTQMHVCCQRADEIHVVGGAWKSPMRSTSIPKGLMSTNLRVLLGTFETPLRAYQARSLIPPQQMPSARVTVHNQEWQRAVIQVLKVVPLREDLVMFNPRLPIANTISGFVATVSASLK